MKKNIFISLTITTLFLLSMLIVSCGGAKAGDYGKAFEPKNIKKINDIVSKKSENVNKTVQVEGEVQQVCPTMACWFWLKDEAGDKIYIDLDMNRKFTVDNISSGDKVIIQGNLVEDGGNVKIMADGVKVK